MRDTKTDKTTARGRPALSDKKIADMRKHIAACALHLYQADGYEAVSMRKLASEAGCTVMTLYRYFDRKIDILRHLWDEVFAEVFEHLTVIAAKDAAPSVRLKAVSLAYTQYWLEHREHYFLVFMSSDISQSDVSIFVENGSVVQRFGAFYQWVGAALDESDAAALTVRAETLLCSLHGICHNLITISGFAWSDPTQLVDMAVEGILRAKI